MSFQRRSGGNFQTGKRIAIDTRARADLRGVLQRFAKQNVFEKQRHAFVVGPSPATLAWLTRHAVGIQEHFLRIKRELRSRAAQLSMATPRWSERDLIERVYRGAAMLSERLGVSFHVDHVVPIKSELVCGLHVHANLQVLESKENSRKGNRHWPDMP